MDIPSHVPSDLVVDFDFYKVAGLHEDIHPQWASFAAKCREIRDGSAHLVYTPHNGGHWLAVTGQAVRDLYADAENLSNQSVTIPARPGLNSLPGEADGDIHAASRMALVQWFTPVRVRSLAEPVRRIVSDLVDELEPRGECEFMREFAFQIPLHLFFELMELPLSDGTKLLQAVDTVVRGSDADTITRALEDVFANVASVVEMRKADPGSDVISSIVTANYRGEPITSDMAVGMGVQLLLAGLDTVAATLGFIIKHLAADADLRRKLASGEIEIKSAAEEFLRRFPTVSLARVVAKDFSYAGVTLRKGERVLLPTAFHGLDPAFFDRPLELDLDRPSAPMLTFGRGPHQCIGTLLARTELIEALNGWLTRIPDFAIAPGQETKLSCGHVAAFSSLPLVWPVR